MSPSCWISFSFFLSRGGSWTATGSVYCGHLTRFRQQQSDIARGGALIEEKTSIGQRVTLSALINSAVADGITSTETLRLTTRSLQVTRIPFQSLVALARSSPTDFGDCQRKHVSSFRGFCTTHCWKGQVNNEFRAQRICLIRDATTDTSFATRGWYPRKPTQFMSHTAVHTTAIHVI